MKKRQLVILLIAASTLFGSYLAKTFFAGMKEEPKQKKQIKAKKYVKTQPVHYSTIETNVVAYGRVQSAQNVDLLSEVSGRMYEGSIRLKEGQKFKKGTLLFYIDDREASLDLKSQKSNFLRDLAAILPDFKVDYSKSFETWNTYFNSIDLGKDLPELPSPDSEKEKTFLATQGIFSTYYNIKSAEVRLKKYRYYAPFDGSVTEVIMQSGSFISPGTRIGKISQTNVQEIKIAIETKEIPWVQEGSVATLMSDETNAILQGEVVRVSDYVNENTQSVDAYLKIFPSANKIYDGQFLQASIPAQSIENGMVIPRSVIYNGNEVFVLEDTLLKVHQIDIYRLVEEEAIVSGIEEGMDLVVEPLVNAHNNMTAFKLEKVETDLIEVEDSTSVIN